MLDEVYRMQRLFNNKVIGFDILAIEREEDRVKWFRNYLTAYDQELKELLESLDRDWILRGAPGQGALDRNNIKVEIVDMLHFLVSMFQVIGEKGLDPRTNRIVEGGIAAETRQTLENVKAILEAAGLGLDRVVRSVVYMTDLGKFAEMNEVYAEYFTADPPGRSCVQVVALPAGAHVEIEVTAAR